MVIDILNRLHSVDEPTRLELATKATGRPIKLVSNWSVEQINFKHKEPTTSGLYRVKGIGLDDAIAWEWSIVVKVVKPSQDPNAGDGDWDYWKREVLAYQSGLISNLPGDLRAPVCYSISAQAQDEVWLWLEDLGANTPGADWSLDRFSLAASHLGQFNGTYLVNSSLIPTYSWLSHGVLEPNYHVLTEPVRRLVLDPRTWDNPKVRAHFREPQGQRFLNIWQDREALLAKTRQLPRTLCHCDAHCDNLYGHSEAQGNEKTIAIDWAKIGSLGVGQELGQFIVVSQEFRGQTEEFSILEQAGMEGYLSGLADVGWSIDLQQVRFGYAVQAVLQELHTFAAVLNVAIHPELHQPHEERFGIPIDVLLEQRFRLHRYLLDLGDEARKLMYFV